MIFIYVQDNSPHNDDSASFFLASLIHFESLSYGKLLRASDVIFLAYLIIQRPTPNSMYCRIVWVVFHLYCRIAWVVFVLYDSVGCISFVL